MLSYIVPHCHNALKQSVKCAFTKAWNSRTCADRVTRVHTEDTGACWAGLSAQTSLGTKHIDTAPRPSEGAGDSSMFYVLRSSWGICGIYMASHLCECAGVPSTWFFARSYGNIRGIYMAVHPYECAGAPSDGGFVRSSGGTGCICMDAPLCEP